MSDCKSCNNTGTGKAVTVLQEQNEVCQSIFHRNVCVQGTITITPDVQCNPCRSFCIGPPIIGSCEGELRPSCEFTVSQNICVQIPLTFSAIASSVSDGLVCGTLEPGPCPGVPPINGCTRTIGFYRNNPEVTNQLITDAGGSITLGVTGEGLSFVVTTANANDVFDFNVPSPPAPEDPPFANQYQVLYAQLLGAKLNVLSLIASGVDVCSFATDAIAAADDFLADSPEDGQAGASDVQEPLELFNSGNAPGCPPHCDD